MLLQYVCVDKVAKGGEHSGCLRHAHALSVVYEPAKLLQGAYDGLPAVPRGSSRRRKWRRPINKSGPLPCSGGTGHRCPSPSWNSHGADASPNGSTTKPYNAPSHSRRGTGWQSPPFLYGGRRKKCQQCQGRLRLPALLNATPSRRMHLRLSLGKARMVRAATPYATAAVTNTASSKAEGRLRIRTGWASPREGSQSMRNPPAMDSWWRPCSVSTHQVTRPCWRSEYRLAGPPGLWLFLVHENVWLLSASIPGGTVQSFTL